MVKMLGRRRGVSAIISTLLIMVTTMLVLSITLSFVQGTLTRKTGETDLESAKTFMKNVALQIDDVAWTNGRVDTAHFTTQFGLFEFLEDVVSYNVTFTNSTGSTFIRIYDSNIFMFNIPTYRYSLSENYYELILPKQFDGISFIGSNSPIARVFAVQNSTVGNAEFIRVTVVPVFRIQNYTVRINANSTTNYVRLYLPELNNTYSSDLPKTIVLTGTSVNTELFSNINKIEIKVDFPLALSPDNYNNKFFKFPEPLSQVINFDVSNVEVFLGGVNVDYGA